MPVPPRSEYRAVYTPKSSSPMRKLAPPSHNLNKQSPWLQAATSETLPGARTHTNSSRFTSSFLSSSAAPPHVSYSDPTTTASRQKRTASSGSRVNLDTTPTPGRGVFNSSGRSRSRMGGGAAETTGGQRYRSSSGDRYASPVPPMMETSSRRYHTTHHHHSQTHTPNVSSVAPGSEVAPSVQYAAKRGKSVPSAIRAAALTSPQVNAPTERVPAGKRKGSEAAANVMTCKLEIKRLQAEQARARADQVRLATVKRNHEQQLQRQRTKDTEVRRRQQEELDRWEKRLAVEQARLQEIRSKPIEMASTMLQSRTTTTATGRRSFLPTSARARTATKTKGKAIAGLNDDTSHQEPSAMPIGKKMKKKAIIKAPSSSAARAPVHNHHHHHQQQQHVDPASMGCLLEQLKDMMEQNITAETAQLEAELRERDRQRQEREHGEAPHPPVLSGAAGQLQHSISEELRARHHNHQHNQDLSNGHAAITVGAPGSRGGQLPIEGNLRSGELGASATADYSAPATACSTNTGTPGWSPQESQPAVHEYRQNSHLPSAAVHGPSYQPQLFAAPTAPPTQQNNNNAPQYRDPHPTYTGGYGLGEDPRFNPQPKQGTADKPQRAGQGQGMATKRTPPGLGGGGGGGVGVAPHRHEQQRDTEKQTQALESQYWQESSRLLKEIEDTLEQQTY